MSDYFVKDLKPGSLEKRFYHQLVGSQLTPTLLPNKNQLVLEKFDGTLFEYLKLNPSISEIQLHLENIVQKVLELNTIYEIQHHDLHVHNVMYRKINGELEWRLIDFELSKEVPPSSSKYNPLGDIFYLMESIENELELNIYVQLQPEHEIIPYYLNYLRRSYTGGTDEDILRYNQEFRSWDIEEKTEISLELGDLLKEFNLISENYL